MARDRDDSERLRGAVAKASESERPLAIFGRGSKTFIGPPALGDMLAIGDHSGVVDYRHDELMLTARSGTPLVELRRILAGHDQMLAFDPPMFAGDGSFGGAIATGLSGPGRPWYGAARDAVLGVTLINGRAQCLRFGGQVMKNVAGYDVSRLMAGAFGTLGVLLDISVKVMPCPQYESTRAFELDRDAALARVVSWSRSPLPLSATCHVDGVLYVRLSGTERGVRAAATALGGEEIAYPGKFWDSLRDHTHEFFHRVDEESVCYRVVLPPAAASPAVDGEWLTEWGGAQRWLSTSVPRQRIEPLVRGLGGYLAQFTGLKWPEQLDKGALKYYRRLKDAFDPNAILNRGRLFQEIGQERGSAFDEAAAG
jgi:glycolate dehydrogenase FAD-binding subunit